MARKPHPSDLIDAQWVWIEPHLPPTQTAGRHREVEMREVINAMLYLTRTGCARRMLPHDFLHGQTGRNQADRFRKDGPWDLFLGSRNVEQIEAVVRRFCPLAGVGLFNIL
jgi:putative transposase